MATMCLWKIKAIRIGGWCRTTDKQEQSDINRRGQIVDAIAALPMPYARNAQGMMKTEFSNQGALPSVQILEEARSLSPVLEEAESKLVEE